MAPRTTRSTRTPNDKQNALPSVIAVTLSFVGKVLGSIAVPQADFLSEAGNVTFAGGIRKGLNLPGEDAISSLTGLGLSVDDGELKITGKGVHQSEKGNPTVCHMGVITLGTGDDAKDFSVQVFTTYLGAEKKFNLNVRAFPRPVIVGGPQVVGEIEGLVVTV